MRFLGFLLRRVVGIAAVMIGVSVITFAISHLTPASPGAAALGDHATESQIAQFRAEYRLDRPLPEQYVIYVTGILHGDLGKSIRTRRSVAQDLADSFPATLELSFAALAIAILVGIPAESGPRSFAVDCRITSSGWLRSSAGRSRSSGSG